MQPFTFFISYRRDDTAPIALLLKHELQKRLQFVSVFVDVADIRAGEVFPQRLAEQIGRSHATIALIGQNWMPKRGKRDPSKQDWVVAEIEQSIQIPLVYPKNSADRHGRSERAVIPLFVDAKMDFSPFDTPESIARIVNFNGKRIDYVSWPGSIGPLIESLALDLNLKVRQGEPSPPKPSPTKARTQALSDVELLKTLAYEDFEGWSLDQPFGADGRCLTQTFEFNDFNGAADFMRAVSDYCRVLDHHPDWRNAWKTVTVSLSTWDANRQITIYDLNLALFINKAAKEVRSRQG